MKSTIAAHKIPPQGLLQAALGLFRGLEARYHGVSSSGQLCKAWLGRADVTDTTSLLLLRAFSFGVWQCQYRFQGTDLVGGRMQLVGQECGLGFCLTGL